MEKQNNKKMSKKKKGILILIMVLILLGAITFIILEAINSPFNEVVINVNGTEIKMSYLIKRIYMDGTETEETMNTIAQEEVIRQSAVAYIQVSDLEIQQYLMELTGNADPARLQEIMDDLAAEVGFSDTEMEELIYTDVLSAKMNQYLIDRIQTVDEQVHLLTIMFDSESELNDTILRLDAGEEFEDLAAELNPTEELRENKGDLGWLSRSSLEDNLASSIFDEMDVGQISEPFLWGESYALFYVVAHEDAREIDADILESMKYKVFDDWLEYHMALSSIAFTQLSAEKESWIEWQLQKMRKESGK